MLGPTQKLISNSFGARLDLACCTHIDLSSLFELEGVGSTLAALYIALCHIFHRLIHHFNIRIQWKLH